MQGQIFISPIEELQIIHLLTLCNGATAQAFNCPLGANSECELDFEFTFSNSHLKGCETTLLCDRITHSGIFLSFKSIFMTLSSFCFGLLLLRVTRHAAISVLLATTAPLALGNLSLAPQALFPPPKDGKGMRNAPPALLEPSVTGLH